MFCGEKRVVRQVVEMYMCENQRNIFEDVLDIVKVAGAKVTGAASYRTRAASSMMLSAKLSR